MKKLLLILFLALTSISQSKSQTAFPAFSDNPSWNVLECFWMTCSTQTYQYVYDTVFCNQTYSKIEMDIGLDGYFRSDNLKTKFRTSNNCNDKEYLLYDYSMNIGDTAYVGTNLILGYPNDTMPVVLIQIDTVNYFGVERQRFKVNYDRCNTGILWSEMFWTRGIGSNLHPFYSIPCLCDFCEGFYSTLCYDSSTTQLYQNPLYNTCDTTVFVGLNENVQNMDMSIYPNPFQTEVQIRFDDSNPVNVKIFNTSGQLIQFVTIEKETFIGAELKPGIYFMEIQSAAIFKTIKLIKL